MDIYILCEVRFSGCILIKNILGVYNKEIDAYRAKEEYKDTFISIFHTKLNETNCPVKCIYNELM